MVMEKRLISANLSTQSVTFRPGQPPATFEVVVRNDSDQQAQFQLELSAAGASSYPGADWYRLSPEVSVAKPPGDETRFQVLIVDSPLPHFAGAVNLTVRVLSPQLPGEARRVLRLIVEAGAEGLPLSLSLVPQHLQVYPRNAVDITVRVCNLTPRPVDAVLRLSGLAPAWMTNGTERRVLLPPSAEELVLFQCQPPGVTQAPNQSYPFGVEASSQSIAAIRADGILEILPVGFIKFAATPPKQSIPAAKGWWLDWKTKTAVVYAAFGNLSNVKSWINVEVGGCDRQPCTPEPSQPALLGLGETVQLPLTIRTQRPWVGLGRKLKLDLYPQLQAGSAVDVEPATQPVELRILPIVPLWLVLAVLALLAALLAWLLQPDPIGHVASVNAMRFSSDALSVVSGSNDCTIRRWTVQGNQLQPEGELGDVSPTSCNFDVNPRGVLAQTTNQIWSIEFFPKDNDRIAAGLANGAVQLWNLPNPDPNRMEQLKDPDDQTGDRVFALAFAEDSRTLYSGHGSGTIRVWQRPPGARFEVRPLNRLRLTNQPDYRADYEVFALALSPDGQYLVSAGSDMTVVLWDLTAPDPNQVPQLLMPQASPRDYVYDLEFAPGTAVLATSDSNGDITLWDITACRSHSQSTSVSSPVLNCQPQRRWRAVEGDRAIPIRSIRFSASGRQLVSADDSGRVMLWTLDGSTDPVPPDGKLLYTSPQKTKSVDSVETAQNLLVVSGGDDRQVVLQRIRREGQ
ncbi:hypothetical protein [Oculatella sp. LEGE 06141]